MNKLSRLPHVDVVGICDTSKIVVEAVAEKFGAGPAFTDFGQMLAKTTPDVVHVLTPPRSHLPLVMDALAAGAHVIVEKPIAVGWQEYRKMAERARHADRMLVESQNFLFNDAVRATRHRIAEGEFGQIVHVSVRYGVSVGDPRGMYGDVNLPHFAHRLPGGALYNVISHPAYVLLAFIGDVEHVVAHRRRMGGGLSDDELAAHVVGSTATGSVVVSSHARPMGFTVQIECTKAVIVLDLYDWRSETTRAGGGLTRIVGEVRAGSQRVADALTRSGRTLVGRHDLFQGLDRLLHEFYEAVGTGAPVPIDPNHVDATVRLVDALLGDEPSP